MARLALSELLSVKYWRKRMSDPLKTLKDQLTPNLTDPKTHAPILDSVLDIVGTAGSKGLKKQVKQWITDIKAKEGV